MTKAKALFFDIDGTLVSFKTHRIPESAVEALQRARTGRPENIHFDGAPRSVYRQSGTDKPPD